MFKNIGSNWVVNILSLAVTFVVTPRITRWLGVDVNGAWAVMVNLTGLLGLMMTGVPLASVRQLTARFTEIDQAKRAGDAADIRRRIAAANDTIATCMGLYVRLGIAACAAGAVLYGVHERLYIGSGRYPADSITDARIAFAILVLQLAGGFVSQVPISILGAYREFVLRNLVAMGSLTLRLVLVLTVFRANPSLTTLAMIQAALLVYDFTVSCVVIRRRHPDVSIGFRGFDRAVMRQIFGFSVFVLLLHLGNKIAFQTDSLVIGAFMTPRDVTTFEYGKLSVLQFSEFVFAIGIVLNPTATKLQVEGKTAELRETFLKWSKAGLSLTLLGGLYLVFIGDEFLRAWVHDPEFDARGAGIVQIVFMASHFVFLPARAIAMPILMGLGHVKKATIAFLACGILNVLLSLALVRPLGLVGVAVGTAIPDVIFGVFALRESFRLLGVRAGEYLAYVALKAFLGSMLMGAALWLARPFALGRPLWVLLGIGAIYAAIFAVVWTFWVFRGDPRLDILETLRLRRRPGRS